MPTPSHPDRGKLCGMGFAVPQRSQEGWTQFELLCDPRGRGTSEFAKGFSETLSSYCFLFTSRETEARRREETCTKAQRDRLATKSTGRYSCDRRWQLETVGEAVHTLFASRIVRRSRTIHGDEGKFLLSFGRAASLSRQLTNALLFKS